MPLSADTIFSICNMLVLPCWLLLLVVPKWQVGRTLICAVVIPLLLGFAYIALFASQIGQIEGGFGSLGEVRQLFANPYLLTAGWLHYLAFDLFIGAWEVRDSRQLGISHFAVVPCLVLTFVAGPAGLALYLSLRWALKRKVAVVDHA